MKRFKGLIIIMAVVMMITTLGGTQRVNAATKYIKVEDYIKYIVKQMKWEVDSTSDNPYIDVAMDKGILKKGDFKNYSSYLTRTDAAAIANRLDELINLKYGYPRDVYEFLKDCTLFENRLYYDISGRFFPEGETDQTYMAQNFSKDVVTDLFENVFPNDSWVERGLRTKYKDVFENDVIVKTFIMIGMASEDLNNDVHIDSFDENAKIIKAWNEIKDGERKLNAVLDKRISDIMKITKSKREAVANIVAKGIIKGYSNGMYIQNREFRGSKKITDAGAKNVIQLVLKPEKRALISPDGQLIRTTKLPKNASDYSYILEAFPNKYYEMNHSFVYLTDYISGEIRDDEYAYPKEVDYNFLYNKFYHNKMKLEFDKYEYYDAMLLSTEKYLKHIFNVDYRTVNDEWKEGLASSLGFYSWKDEVYEGIDKYIESIKKNHTVVELGKIAIDPGAIYECREVLRVRVYVKYRVTADDIGVPTNQLIYGPDTYIKNIKNGVWKESILDIFMDVRSENNLYKWRPSASVPLSDWQYRDSFK